jgi:molybdate transport system regulatory protein
MKGLKMNMLSARNQFPGTVKTISRGAVNAEVIIKSDSGLELSSIITLGSCVRMNLEPGTKVFAVIKASDILIGVGTDFKISASNNLPGSIKKILRGAVNDEIILDANGTELVAIITEASTKRLGLTEGTKASALIKASNVLIMK